VRGDDVKAAVGEETIEVEQAREAGSLFVARLDRETRTREREPAELVVDARRLHFFDIATSDAIYDRAAD